MANGVLVVAGSALAAGSAVSQVVIHEIPTTHPLYGRFEPAALSGDGRTVIGAAADGPEGTIGLIWTVDRGFEEAPTNVLPRFHSFSAVSADGSVVIGTLRRGDQAIGFRWTRGVAVELLENATDGVWVAAPESVSRDGEIVTGSIRVAGVPGGAGALWRVGPRTLEIPVFDGAEPGMMSGVSDDGRIAAGRTRRGRPLLWRDGVGTIELPSVEETRAGGRAFLTGPGDVVFGSASYPETNDLRPMVWRDGYRSELLEPTWGLTSTVIGVNRDGRVAVMNSYEGQPAVVRTAVWTSGVGIEFLGAYARRFGATVNDTDLEMIRGVSDDGRAFLVYSRSAPYWLVVLPPADPADFNLDGIVDAADVKAFLACLDGESVVSPVAADVNGDGFTDFFDLIEFMERF